MNFYTKQIKMNINIIKEHDSCPYNSSSERNIIEQITLTPNENIRILTSSNKIILVVIGKITASIGVQTGQKVAKDEMFYVPIAQNLTISTTTNTTLLIFRFRERIKLCNCFLIDKLTNYRKTHQLFCEKQFHILSANHYIKNTLISLLEFTHEKFNCEYYYKLKLNELTFHLGKFYTLEELALFFKESISDDSVFADYVRENAHKYRTMTELAEAMNYTISGFEKRFKKIFKVTPYQWMKEKKAQQIFYDLSMTDLCLKEIVDNYGFKSNNYFIDFCKSNLGASPGTIRRNRGWNKNP